MQKLVLDLRDEVTHLFTYYRLHPKLDGHLADFMIVGIKGRFPVALR